MKSGGAGDTERETNYIVEGNRNRSRKGDSLCTLQALSMNQNQRHG